MGEKGCRCIQLPCVRVGVNESKSAPLHHPNESGLLLAVSHEPYTVFLNAGERRGSCTLVRRVADAFSCYVCGVAVNESKSAPVHQPNESGLLLAVAHKAYVIFMSAGERRVACTWLRRVADAFSCHVWGRG